MSHYFVNDPKVKSQKQQLFYTFNEEKFIFETDNGVFSKGEIDEGSYILLKTLVKQDLGKRILDLGCGYGTIGIILKRYYSDAEIDMVDINEKAVLLSKHNCDLNQTANQVYLSDGFSSVKDNFDTIVTNPPIRAGKQVIYQMFEDAYEHLVNEGTLYVVMRKSHGALSAMAKLKSRYGNATILDKEAGFYVLVSRRQA